MSERVKVIDKTTGAESFVPVGDFDPTDHEVVEGQVATVAPLGGDEFASGQEVTERSLAGDALLPQFSPEARAELTAEQVEESTFDTTGNIVEQAARGVASGLTVGLSDLVLAEDDPFERERARRERAAAPGTFAIGQAVGSIAPALLSGGAGALGTAARLSPTGQLAALSGRFASGSKGIVGRALRTAGGGAAEGAADGVANYLANVTIQENPQFSAEALGSQVMTGALFGAAAGGAAELLGAGLKRLGGKAPASIDDALAGDFRGLDTPALSRVDDVAPAPQLSDDAFEAPATQDLGVFELGGGAKLETRAVVGSRTNIESATRDLVGKIDDDAAEALLSSTEDLARLGSRIDDTGVDEAIAAELKDALGEASNRFLAAGNNADAWAREAMETSGDASGGLSKAMPEELEERGIDALAELDDAGAQWRAASGDVETGLAEAVAAANAQAAAGPGLGERIRGISARLRGGGSGGGVATAIGTVEAARDVGIDVPLPSVRDIPVFGGAMAFYAKLKAAGHAARRVGVLPSTSATRAASTVNTAQARVRSAVSNAARRVARAGGAPIARKFTAATGRKVAKEITELNARTSDQVAAQAEASVGVNPQLAAAAAVVAVRAHGYLAENAPRNPFEGTPAESTWTPTPQQQADWAIRKRSVSDPVGTIERSMRGGFPDTAVDGIRAVYPELYQQTQHNLQTDRARLEKRMPSHVMQSLGRVYGVPMTVSQMPGYGASTVAALASRATAQIEQGPPPTLARKVNASTSPLGDLDETRAGARAAARR